MKRKQTRREKHTQIKAPNPLLSEAAFDVGDFLFSELLEGSGESPSSPACASLLLKKGAPSNFSTHRPQVWVGTQHKVPPPCNSQSEGGVGGGGWDPDQPASTSSLNGKTQGAGTPGASFQRQPAGKHQPGQASTRPSLPPPCPGNNHAFPARAFHAAKFVFAELSEIFRRWYEYY